MVSLSCWGGTVGVGTHGGRDSVGGRVVYVVGVVAVVVLGVGYGLWFVGAAGQPIEPHISYGKKADRWVAPPSEHQTPLMACNTSRILSHYLTRLT